MMHRPWSIIIAFFHGININRLFLMSLVCFSGLLPFSTAIERLNVMYMSKKEEQLTKLQNESFLWPYGVDWKSYLTIFNHDTVSYRISSSTLVREMEKGLKIKGMGIDQECKKFTDFRPFCSIMNWSRVLSITLI